MKIKVDEAQKITEKYGIDDIPIILRNDVILNDNGKVVQITQGMKYDPSQYELYKKSNVKEIDVIYTERLYVKLAMNFPNNYRMPIDRKSLVELDKIIDTLEIANSSSKRKRDVICLNEIYKKSPTGTMDIIINFGEVLDYKKWNNIKGSLNRNTLIDYRFNEVGIIVFCILKAGEPNYAQKFMRFTEVVSLLVEQEKELNGKISNDFNPETDVYTVNEKEQLLKTYIDKKASMIIVADDINDEYKIALAQIKNFDKWAKFMVIKSVDPNKKKELLILIKQMYNKNLWEE